MYSDNDLTEAVAAGVIPADAAEAFRARVAAARHLPRVDQEHYRILDGGNDGFVTVAALLLIAGLGYLGWTVQHILSGAVVAASAWGLAEQFVRVRRHTLTGIALSLAFAGGVAATLILALVAAAPGWSANAYAVVGAGIAALTGAATWQFWRRFDVPFAMSLVALAGVGVVMALAIAVLAGPNIPGVGNILYPIALACGVGVFAFAMRWDMSDPDRVTHRHEVGFWVHGVAGSLIAQSIFYLIAGGGMSPMAFGFVSIGQVITIFVLVGLFTFVGLAVDRRALVYSSIGAFLYAIVGLLVGAGANQSAFGLAGAIVGAALLALSAYWHQARRAIFPLLGGLADRLPPLETAEEPELY